MATAQSFPRVHSGYTQTHSTLSPFLAYPLTKKSAPQQRQVSKWTTTRSASSSASEQTQRRHFKHQEGEQIGGTLEYWAGGYLKCCGQRASRYYRRREGWKAQRNTSLWENRPYQLCSLRNNM